MNDLNNILLMQTPGLSSAPQTQANGPGQQGLLGFLNQIVQQLQAAPANGAAPTAALPATPFMKDLAAKIAVLLQNDGTLPAALQNITPENLAAKIIPLIQKNIPLQTPALPNLLLPETSQAAPPPKLEELAAKITALLQKDAALASDTSIKPSLNRDLVARLSAEIQNAPVHKGKDIILKIAGMLESGKDMPVDQKLAELLNKIEPGSGNNSDIIKILQQLQRPEPEPEQAQPADPILFEKLKEQIVQLQTQLQKAPDAVPPVLLGKLKDIVIQLQKSPAPAEPALLQKLKDVVVRLEQQPKVPVEVVQHLQDKITELQQPAPTPPKTDLLEKLEDIIVQLQQKPPAAVEPALLEKLKDTVVQLQPQAPAEQALPPAALKPELLQQLKDKIVQLQLTKGEINKAVLVEFKADIVQFMEDEGLEQPEIEHHLAALVKFLRSDDAADITIDKPAEQPVLNAPPAPPQQADTENPAPLPGHKHTHSRPVTPHAPLLVDNEPVKTLPQDIKQQPAPAPAQKDSPAQHLPLPTAAAPPAQTPTPAPQPNLTGKIAGFSISPHMINALASSDGEFSADSFGTGSNSQSSDIMHTLHGLKPATVDTLNSQNFANYMSGARNTPHPATQMLHIQMQRNIIAKIDTMTVQLNPADLGRVDIELKFDKEGSVKAHMTVDRPETLALLQKDSHHLERMLQQSGLDADETSLSFDLRQQNKQQDLEGYNGGGNKGNADEFNAHLNGSAAENALQAKIAIQANGYITQSGVNIMV